MRMVLPLLVLILPFSAVGQNLPETYPPEIDRGSYYLQFTPTDSARYSNPESLVDSSSVSNLDFLHPPPEGRSPVWKLDLTSKHTVRIDPRTHASTTNVSYHFEGYYPQYEVLLFKSRQNEYTRYVLVSRRTGGVVTAFGPPIFSPSGKWFVTLGEDSPSGWSPKGLQLFAAGKFGFQEVVRFRTGKISRVGIAARKYTEGGPSRCQWIDDNTFRLEMLDTRIKRGKTNYYRHYRVDIRETEAHSWRR